ncbi:hypothetical protein HanXRQr2_Chr09g0374971 [Helianthus annuus]|uniref:Uncharacterized protein n=1 Tax=Helianthus annuus TaxID=4232 RepID=A0A9K3I453_HELAN|nr:hypothetical protein HanXRQr2_Chr09g0374971 [Helianthus annuus]
MDSPATGDSDTTGPLPIVSDDIASSEHEVHTSDFTSTDDDDFQPFALPDGADEHIDDPPAEYLPLVAIPAPIPLASYPAYDLLPDAEADGDIDLFEDEPYEDEIPDAAPLPVGDLLMIAGAPVEDSPDHSPVPDSFESVASAPSHEVSTQHFEHDSDPDQASSAAPIPSFVFEHDDIEDSDPVFPPGFDPDRDIEYIPMDQHMEDPVDPVDPVDPFALDPEHEHDLVHAGVPDEPILADPPVGDHLVDIPLIADDHIIADDPVEAQHGWIPADEDVPPFPPHHTDAHHADFSFQIPQFVPPAGSGEGSSAHPFGHIPMPIPFVPQMTSVPSSVSSIHAAPFDPTSTPLLWSSSSPMPPTDPYHPFHMGYTIEDVLMSFVHQHESHTQRLQELERAQLSLGPYHGQTSSPFQPFRSLPPDFAARLQTLEQQIASVIHTQQAMEEDWLHLRRLLYTHFPPPPPPSA